MLTGVAGSRYFWGLGGQAPFFSAREGYLKTIKMYRFIFFPFCSLNYLMNILVHVYATISYSGKG